MKKRIRLTESDLHRVIKESVKRVLNEMGTPKQNSFLRSLMGSRYDPSYDRLPVSDTSALISKELAFAKQRANSPVKLATAKQIDFIKGNRYYAIPTIESISDKLTIEDAKSLVEALNPYTNGTFTYYGHSRERKEVWLPRMKSVVVPILQKYGLDNEANDVSVYVDTFMDKYYAKIERDKKKAEEKAFNDAMNSDRTLFFISSQDEENLSSHQVYNVHFHNFYMDGKLENAMGWDIADLCSDLSKITMDDLKKQVFGGSYSSYNAIVLGYDKLCKAVFWPGPDLRGNLTIHGRIVDYEDYSKVIALYDDIRKGVRSWGDRI